MSSEIKVTLVKSHIGASEHQRAVLNGLGLTKRNKTVMLKDSPEIRGMVAKVAHMITVEK